MSKAHRAYFNRIAPEWSSRMPDDPVFRDYLVRFGVSSGDVVLDLGAGTGRMTRHLIELVGERGMVVAEDIAEEMLFQGRALLGSAPPAWLCDDACSLAFKDDTFNKVLCFSTFPHFMAPRKALWEIHRVLRPGGRFLILHTSSSRDLNAFHASLDGVVNHDVLPSAGEMTALLEQTRFSVIEGIDRDGLYWVGAEKRGEP